MDFSKAQPLSFYDVLQNDEGEIMLCIPGVWQGEAVNPIVYYDGKRDAVFVRDENAVFILDYLNEGIREGLMKAPKIIVNEFESGYAYEVGFKKEDVAKDCKKALDLHSYEFPNYPFPYATGALKAVDERCDFCKKKPGLLYVGPVYPTNKEVSICTKCIEKGRIKKMTPEGRFATKGGLKYEYLPGYEDVMYKTPPYPTKSKKGPVWLNHHDKVCTYRGKIDAHIFDDDKWEECLKNWEHGFQDYPESEAPLIRELVKEGRMEAHLFACSVCGARMLYFTEKFS